jgi:hypothetical protein
MSRFSMAFVLLLMSTSVRAQDTFTPLTSGLKVGQKVRILVDGTCGTAECPGEVVKGKIKEMAAESLVVDDGHARRELPAVNVRFVERPKDRIWNGVLAGFGVGFGVGFVSVMTDGCDPGEWCILDGPSFAAAVGLFGGAIGAGVGALTDFAISNRRVVFARSSENRVSTSISPIAGPGRGGIRVSVSF